MKRWHSPRERALMVRRWRQEIARHESGYGRLGRYPWTAMAPVPPQDCAIWEEMYRGGLCHCYRGMGFMRKSGPYGCSHPRCALCHFEKFYEPKRRGARKRKEIAYELEAAGLLITLD